MTQTIEILNEVKFMLVALGGMVVAGILAYREHPWLAIFLAIVALQAGKK